MNIIKAIIDVFGVLMEIIIISSFFNMFAAKRVEKKQLALIYSGYLIIASLCCVFVSSEIFLFLRILIAVFALSFIYDTTLLKRIFLSIIVMIMLLLTEFLTGVTTSAITKLPVQDLLNNPLYYLQGVVISKMLLIVLIKASGHYIKPKNIQISKPTIVVLLILPIATLLIIYVLSDYAIKLQTENTVIMVLAILGLVIANIALIYLFEWQLRREEKHIKDSIERKHIESQVEYYKKALATRQEYNKIIHNFKNQLFAIGDLVSKNNPEGINKINELCDFVVASSQTNYTQSDSLNALLHSKRKVIDDNSIEFTCESIMLEQNDISELDLCLVVGNLLDNSIEACLRMEEGRKYIDLKIKQQGDYLAINLINSFNEKEGMKINQTSKDDKTMHGFGLKSVREIAKVHNGTLNIITNENEFIASVILNNPIRRPNT